MGALILGAILACGETSQDARPADVEGSAGPLRVAVVNYPLAYMAERIGGDALEVVFPAPRGVDPAFWRPRPEDIALFQGADLILLNGAGYAAWAWTASLPTSHIVDTSAAFEERLLERPDLVTHSHGPDGDHAHGQLAITTWLDLELAMLQAAAVRDALQARRPASSADFRAAYDALELDLRALDERLLAAVSTDQPVIFSHPVYDYLARRYAIEGPSLHWEPDEAPSAEQWAELDAAVAQSGATWVIWEGEPLPQTVRQLQERGLESAVFSPCGNRPASGDLLDALAAGAQALERVFGAH